jgi:hypothetical protein
MGDAALHLGLLSSLDNNELSASFGGVVTIVRPVRFVAKRFG